MVPSGSVCSPSSVEVMFRDGNAALDFKRRTRRTPGTTQTIKINHKTIRILPEMPCMLPAKVWLIDYVSSSPRRYPKEVSAKSDLRSWPVFFGTPVVRPICTIPPQDERPTHCSSCHSCATCCRENTSPAKRLCRPGGRQDQAYSCTPASSTQDSFRSAYSLRTI
jgi:hypothetical protein